MDEIELRRMVSFDKIVDYTHLFQYLIYIWVTKYHPPGPPPHFLPSSAVANPRWDFPTPPNNPWVLGTSYIYWFSIIPWMQATTWHQANAGNSTQFDQANVGTSNNWDQPNIGFSTSLGNEYIEPLLPNFCGG